MAPIPDRGDKRAFFDININGEPAGRVVFALWNFKCPKTVENFRTMCTGELGELFGHKATYQGNIFHRVIKGFMIQGGDITRKNGSGGFSIYGPTFDDENLALKHSKPYLLSMANRGPDTNGSQFFITTAEVPHLDGKHCVFGEVIKGFEVIKAIEELETGEDDVPTQKVQIVNCGEMVKKGDALNKTEKEQEVDGVKMDNEPRTNNWLMRRSRSPVDRKKSKKDRSERRRSRSRSNDRQRRDRGRDRSHDRSRRDDRGGRREERSRPVVSKDGVKVKGRGRITFLGARLRSRTPPHWKKEESKKESLEAHQRKMIEEEERKKREQKKAEIRAREEKEQAQRDAQKELERQKKEAQRELERQEEESSSESEKESGSEEEKVSRSPSVKSSDEASDLE